MDRSWWIGPLLVVFLALLLTLPGVPSVARGASPAAAPGAHPALAATAPRHHDPDPANISVNGVSPSAVSVSWNDTDDRPMGGYNLSYSTSGDSGPWTLAANVASGPNNSSQQYSWQGLSPGTTYWLTVTEVDSPSLQTDPGPVVRETQPPVAHLTSSNPNATTIALAWDNRAQYGGGISFGGYAVESSTNGGGWAIVTVITNASNRSATLSGLDPTASYSFRVATTDVCCGGSPVTTTSNTVNYSAVPPMGASASVRPASADVGQALNFTCTGRGGLPPYSYTWNFGDGTTATGQTASHAYGTPGPYSATCTVQDSRGYSATAPPQGVTISSRPTITLGASPARVDPGYRFAIGANVSGGSDPIGPPTWSFGDGGTATGALVDHAYSAPGNYTVTVQAVDANGVAANASRAVDVLLLKASANSSVRAAPLGGVVEFFGNASGGAGGPYRYAWTFGDGASATGASVNHSYANAGNYSPRLTVTDALGVSANVTLPLIAVDEPLGATIAVSQGAPVTGQMVALTAQISGGNGHYSCSWNFGDTRASSSCTTSHAWSTAGRYTVTLVVTDPTGARASSSTVVTVAAAPSTGTTPPPPPGPFSGAWWIANLWLVWLIVLVVLAALILVAFARVRRADRAYAPTSAAVAEFACPNCGAPVPAGAAYCPTCEQPLGGVR